MKRHILPILGIIALWVFILIQNYTPGTFLTGWDNLHPEFDFALNIKRSLFGVWQEYQGLGLLGGMGHIAALPRELILWTISLVLPTSFLRYAWTFLMLLAGPLGAYGLAWHLIGKISNKTKHEKTVLIGATAAGLFYLFNLNTVQTFIAPYEAFVTHYGILPWLLLSAVRYLDTPNRRTLLLYGLISVLGMTQAYVPTLFLVYLITLIPITIVAFLHMPMKKSLRTIGILAGTTTCINAMWALPFVYFTLTNSNVVVNSKINQMATEEIFLKNKKYGTLLDTLRLKNFWFDTIDVNPATNTNVRILNGWQNFSGNFYYQMTSFILMALVIGGLIISLKQKKLRVWSVVGTIAFTMVAVDTIPSSTIVSYLHDHVPLLHQFFRFPFTKWGTTLSLVYSILFGLMISTLIQWQMNKYPHAKRVPTFFILILLPVLTHILILTQPLLSPLMEHKIQKEYTDLFATMKKKTLGRIAYLPIQSFWDWKYFRWGYIGSGFLWYGVNEPVLDQAFNSWNKYNENYYWELSRAIYSKDSIAVASVFLKYDIKYILLDENIVNPDNNRSLYTEEIKTMLVDIPSFRKSQHLGKLTLYERTDESTTSFISLKQDLPIVSPVYSWTDNDAAYRELGDYITNSLIINSKSSENNSILYPFRSLFTKRSINEREFIVSETVDKMIIHSVTEATSASILKTETIVYDSARTTDFNPQSVTRCALLQEGVARASLDIDGNIRFTSKNQRGCLNINLVNQRGPESGLTHKDGYLVIVENRHVIGQPLLFALINQTAKHTEQETYLETKTGANKQRKEDWQVDYFILPPLAPDGLGYTIYVSNDSIGRQESINDLKRIRVYKIPYQKLVTMRSDNVINLSHSQTSSVDFSVEHPNSAYYKVKINKTDMNQTLTLSQSFDPGWKAYTVNDKCQMTNDKCSWEDKFKDRLKHLLPFLFGTELKEHVLVNNWANGWLLDRKTIRQEDNKKRQDLTVLPSQSLTVVVFFLPQLLEWFGFALLPVPFLFLFLKRFKK